ncbi:hypothetical protein [Corynebacterium antarcticum]|uniref:hypothetical protein n=1 Tax=Corynebacterium antarcticum TaxID=2800405 RepID=UPI00200331E3|nr:hypothetical protein [Corynebacterium antarcticum]MCK7643233.1 hypothetical protein [Corynebacterium antarcticum]MCX7492746.1 hypothetical protein [Corynebacterium antarcticum]MCX7541077.1 hypothetical protein [Corynebacterium antarcticum]
MGNAKETTVGSAKVETASGTWDGQAGGTDLRKARRTLMSVALFLGVLTVFYAALTFFARSWEATAAGLGGAVGIALVTWLLSRRWPEQAVPSRSATRFVNITSALEGIAITAAFILGIFDLWWLFLPLVLTSVSLHFISMLIAYRRAVDRFVVPVTLAATALAWSAGTTDFSNEWAIAGGMLSGCCAGYALALLSVARKLGAAA